MSGEMAAESKAEGEEETEQNEQFQGYPFLN